MLFESCTHTSHVPSNTCRCYKPDTEIITTNEKDCIAPRRCSITSTIMLRRYLRTLLPSYYISTSGQSRRQRLQPSCRTPIKPMQGRLTNAYENEQDPFRPPYSPCTTNRSLHCSKTNTTDAGNISFSPPPSLQYIEACNISLIYGDSGELREKQEI